MVESVNPEVGVRAKQIKSRDAKRDTVKKMRTRVGKRVARSTARSVTASFGEAIPWVGTAIIVSSLALEINDACETMKDLDELGRAFDLEEEDETSKVCGIKPPSVNELGEVAKQAPTKAWNAARESFGAFPEITLESIPTPDFDGLRDWFDEGWKGWQ